MRCLRTDRIRRVDGAIALLCLVALSASGAMANGQGAGTPGERVDAGGYGPAVIESMVDVRARERANPRETVDDPKGRNGRQGVWTVPSRRGTYFPHSGEHNVVNKWGDTRMGIRFPEVARVAGAYLAGQAGDGVWARGVRVVGYRAGREVARTRWFRDIGREPQWFAINLEGVDRIVFEAQAVYAGGGWYGMDDLTYTRASAGGRGEPTEIVVDFEDVPFSTKLTGSGYAGLTWETGTGDFDSSEAVHAPRVPPNLEQVGPIAPPVPEGGPGNLGTLPDLERSFRGIRKGQAGSGSYPPDTHGAVGPDHFVETVNRVFAVYDKQDGSELAAVHLGSFLPGSNGDPRVLFDQHSMRWVVIVSDFSSRIFLAVSLTSDPLGAWFKTSFNVSEGADAGRWPDYPTLGVDAHGIYTAAFMVGGGSRMTLFAIDKAPLLAPSPSLGTITAFRTLPWEGAIQPVHTYGQPGGEYVVSRRSSTTLRVRRIDPPLSNPTLAELGDVIVPAYSNPPDAPALGSVTPLDTVDNRLMMAVFRNGSVWATHTIGVDGRAACRWYEFNPETLDLQQSGTVSDSVLDYFFPSIMVNQTGGAAMGFTGSSPDHYASAYYTGRRATDPLGEMAQPAVLRAGTAPQNNIDGVGRNRWGDYSYATLDPMDEERIWTIQEYAHGVNVWGTWVGVLTLGDCNSNDIRDECDLDCGASGGECAVAGCGSSRDCNANGRPDECDIFGINSLDLNEDGIPDECPVPGDFDGDHDVDLTDFSGFVECASAAGAGELPPQCVVLDFDGSLGVDLLDFGSFQSAHTGDCGVVIIAGPSDTTACPGGVAILSVEAAADTLTYRWYRNGFEVPGETGSTLTIGSVNETTAGQYAVYAVSGCGVARSADVTLAMHAPPVITAPPVFAFTCVGGSAEFSVGAVGVEPLAYQWQRDGVNIAGANGSTITVAPVDAQDAGNYRCVVTGGCGQSVVSPSEILVVTSELGFTLQPIGGTYCAGDDLFVTASATGLPLYQWYKSGVAIDGATTPFLGIADLTTDDAGVYFVIATNDCETGTSELAFVTVVDCP